MTTLLWLDGGNDVAAHMARDAALLERAAAGALAAPVLRLFAFDPPGITLGRSQDAAAELDLERLSRAGVRWASRPTGGRAIWHEEEWTFSLAARLSSDGWAADARAAYERTARLLVRALRSLGVPAVLSPGSPRAAGPPRARAGATPPCFASTARHELTLDGKKLAGIAQRATRGVLLQQSSLLLGPAHAKLARWVRGNDADRAALEAEWRDAAAAAADYLGEDRSLERLAGALERSLAAEGGVHRLDREEGARALALGPARPSEQDCLSSARHYTAPRASSSCTD